MSNKIYTSIPAPKVPRNTFNRSHPNTLTMQFQRVTPTLLEEIYPGDMFRCSPEVFARLQPLVAPVMNNMKISQHLFYVPLRTVTHHYAEFMFGNRMGTYDEVLPYVHTGFFFVLVDALHDAGEDSMAAEVIRLLDFIGLPFRYSSTTSAVSFVSSWLTDSWNIKVAGGDPEGVEATVMSGFRINLCPFFAYQKIVSEYFRDENVEDDPFEVFEEQTDQDPFDWTGDVSTTLGDLVSSNGEVVVASLFVLRRRAWQHDRFTSSLPFAQRGPDVLLPISGQADVSYKDGYLQGDIPGKGVKVVSLAGNPQLENKTPLNRTQMQNAAGNNIGVLSQGGFSATTTPLGLDPNGSLEVDFSQAGLTTTINDFRTAERVQRFFENDARGGVRPNEGTLSHFGVRTPDASLDRAEFLGGSMQPIVVSEVAQTSESTASSPQGTLAGKGTSYKSHAGFRMFFTEHGFVFNLTSALVRANYWQGIPKVFSRMQRDEYYWPEFANLGEEPVFTKELFADSTVVNEDTVFGYVPRYSDLKTAQGEVHGDMRSSLSFWTQVREFSNRPVLNREFLFADPDLSPFAVQSLYSDPIIVTIQFNVKASRLMPFYGVPTI